MPKVKALIRGTWDGSLDETPEVRTLLSAANSDAFRDAVSAGASAKYPAEPGRYHLYVSYACPWAHRAIIYRKLKRLEDIVSMSVLHPRWAGPDGWRFADTQFSTVDHAAGKNFLHEVYTEAKPDFTGRVTVPVLWDKKTSSIVNNESGQIIRLLNSAFDAWADPAIDFYPPHMRAQIDACNQWVLTGVCTAVYRAGFARSQQDYDKAVATLFKTLDELESLLSITPYLCGDQPTEADWHLFTALSRFDAVYHGALRCNVKRLVDYPALSAYTRRVNDVPGVAETVRRGHMKMHYYDAIDEIDRTIVPAGPAVDYASMKLAS